MALQAKLPSTAVGRRRLLKLADMLEADAQNAKGIKFDFCHWGTVHNEDKPVSCGTTACAMGLAAISGAFQRQGLDYRVKKSGEVEIKYGVTRSPLLAAARLFEISETQACYLFALSGDLPAMYGSKGERAVAKRIRDFVAGKTAA